MENGKENEEKWKRKEENETGKEENQKFNGQKQKDLKKLRTLIFLFFTFRKQLKLLRVLPKWKILPGKA